MNKLTGILLILLVFMGIKSVTIAEEVETGSVLRAGLGIPYGILGVNYEYPIQNRIALRAGLGISPNGGKGCWAGGSKLYMNKNTGRNLRFYISGLYGVVSTRRDSYITVEPVSKRKNGLAVGLGFGKRSWHIEFLYVGRKDEHVVSPAFGWAIK